MKGLSKHDIIEQCGCCEEGYFDTVRIDRVVEVAEQLKQELAVRWLQRQIKQYGYHVTNADLEMMQNNIIRIIDAAFLDWQKEVKK